MTSALTVTLIRDQGALTAHTAAWWDLWQRTPAATPFQSPAWLVAWWKAFRPGELLTAAVSMGDRLVGLAPFYLERGSHCGRILPLGISLSDFVDVLAAPDAEEAVLAAVANTYARCGDTWSEWELTELAPQAIAHHIPVPAGCGVDVDTTTACPVLSLVEENVPAKMRRKLRMIGHRVDRHGRAVVLSTSDRDPSWWRTQLWRLHAARWASVGESGVLSDQRLETFHMHAMPELAEHGLLRLYALVLDDAVAGVYYGFHHAGKAYAYLGGFDPAYAYYSPGTYLVGHAVRQAAAEGAREFHFLRGREAYKYAWGATDVWNSRRAFRRCSP